MICVCFYFRYGECMFENNSKVSHKCFHDECFRVIVISCEFEMHVCFSNIISHMLTNSKKRYLFLTIKHNTYVMIWFLNVNYGKGFMLNWMCERAKNCGITCDRLIILNVSPSITIMVVVSVPDEITSIFTRHCNLKTWNSYNHMKLLKVCTIQKIIQSPYDENLSKLLQ